jgi:predicted O-methyltransferase YrrM
MPMSLVRRMQKLLKSTLLKAPFGCRHFELSLISSSDDDCGPPSERLLDTALQSVAAARTIQLPEVSARVPQPPLWPDVWPGEHYRLLAGLVDVLRPKVIVEIGTYTGLSALAMRERMPAGSKLVTFDILPWDRIPHSHLMASDLADGRLQQVIADLADPVVFRSHLPLLGQAELIFVDGPKNVTFEEAFLNSLAACDLPQEPLIVFDDIRLWNMLRIWRGISRPKLDLTSFGHWSGTGLVDWTRTAAAQHRRAA